jgi:hypothetical protein
MPMPCAGSRWLAAVRRPRAQAPSPCRPPRSGHRRACRYRPRPSSPTHAASAERSQSSRQSPRPGWMIPLVIKNHPYRSLADLGRKLVRRLAHTGCTFLGVGASDKPDRFRASAARGLDARSRRSGRDRSGRGPWLTQPKVNFQPNLEQKMYARNVAGHRNQAGSVHRWTRVSAGGGQGSNNLDEKDRIESLPVERLKTSC